MKGVAASRRRSRGWPAEHRAKTLAAFQARIAAREAADPTAPFKQLFRLADPSALHEDRSWRTTLAGYHATMRRAHVLRAWCAVRCGWRAIARTELRAAGHHRRCERGARKEGR